MRKKAFKSVVILLAVSFVLSGCSLFSKRPPQVQPAPIKGDNGGSEPAPVAGSIGEQLAAQTKIKKFENINELKVFLEQKGSGTSGGYYGGMMLDEMSVRKEMALPSVAPTQSADNLLWGGTEGDVSTELGLGSGSGSRDYSKTNIQVEGVDESDIIKTDGKYIYAVSNNNLFIVDAYPADGANVLTKIEFKSRPQDIYINGDFLIVYGQNDYIYNTEVYKSLKRRSNYTFFKVFNIKDRKKPKQVRDLDFEGNYMNSRMIGDYVYFVTSNSSYYYDDEPLPLMIENEETVINRCAADKCVMPPVYYFDMPYSDYNYTTIAAVNVKDSESEVNSEVYLLSGNQNMYVSQNNIYITYTKYVSEYQLQMEVMREIVYPKLPEKDRSRIAKIESTESFILSDQEKMSKVAQILERYDATLTDEERQNLQKDIEEKLKQKYEDISKELEKTVIHKIAIDQGKLSYKTFGEVTGYVLNQFSMDESNGYFRIATTKNRSWNRWAENDQNESYSNLYVLDENLKLTGRVEELAKGEQIYSVRFMQGRAYMVTFKQTDPLFVIDLKDPANPKVLGKLKIPGFSSYLHPYDENTLIGIGKETTENEWGGAITGGVKLSLFDVSDVANPKEIDKYELGDRGSDSIALQDHKAFLFSLDKNLLVIPVTIYEKKSAEESYGSFAYEGAAVFKVDKTGFELKGEIDHSNGKQGERDYWGGYYYYDSSVRRSLYIDDVLYTFSNQYIKMNNISDLSLVKNLELKKEKSGQDDDFEIIN